mmetsp:Transcript_12873/g.45366  ORF Transcript_12873/g.45366 Transcript_12873/m.45366 type:complete len:200 (+) Transcript_12873:567-1166(+)
MPAALTAMARRMPLSRSARASPLRSPVAASSSATHFSPPTAIVGRASPAAVKTAPTEFLPRSSPAQGCVQRCRKAGPALENANAPPPRNSESTMTMVSSPAKPHHAIAGKSARLSASPASGAAETASGASAAPGRGTSHRSVFLESSQERMRSSAPRTAWIAVMHSRWPLSSAETAPFASQTRRLFDCGSVEMTAPAPE